jgi:hypothetical protein
MRTPEPGPALKACVCRWACPCPVRLGCDMRDTLGIRSQSCRSAATVCACRKYRASAARNDLEIARPRSTATAAPRGHRRWRQLAQYHQRLTVRALRNANAVVCEGGAVHWAQGLMKTTRRAKLSRQSQYTSNCQGLRPCLDLLAAARTNPWPPSP